MGHLRLGLLTVSESQERAKCTVEASLYLKSLMTGSWKSLKLHPNFQSHETDVALFKFKLLFSVWCKAGGLGVQFTDVGAMIDDKTYDPRVYYMNHTESNKVKAVAVFMSSVYRVLCASPLFTKWLLSQVLYEQTFLFSRVSNTWKNLPRNSF